MAGSEAPKAGTGLITMHVSHQQCIHCSSFRSWSKSGIAQCSVVLYCTVQCSSAMAIASLSTALAHLTCYSCGVMFLVA